MIVEPISGTWSFPSSALWIALARLCAGVAVQHDIFKDDDRIVDDQANRGGETAESHEIETLAGHFQDDECDQQRRQESPGRRRAKCPSRARTTPESTEERIMPSSTASRTLAMESCTIVDWS